MIAEARGTDPVARADYTASGDDNVIVEGIGGTDTSLGWVGFSFFEQNADVIRALEVDGGDGCVAPTRRPSPATNTRSVATSTST